MKTSKSKAQVLHIRKSQKTPSNKAKFSIKKLLKTEIKKREKLLQKQQRISQEYCEKCGMATICYTNADRKEFNRLHKDHKISFLKKLQNRFTYKGGENK